MLVIKIIFISIFLLMIAAVIVLSFCSKYDIEVVHNLEGQRNAERLRRLQLGANCFSDVDFYH